MQLEKNIVLIEDSETQATAIAAFMSRYGINVAMATDPLQGLRLIDAFKPDAIVIDLNMPVMDGFQICRRLKRDKNTADIPVIMVTASTNEQDVTTGASVGVTKYIKKDDGLTDNLFATLHELDISR